jgi:F0F1-type ATP synthase membrane subunit c/vacuolar-type H+-ATPase subunit K
LQEDKKVTVSEKGISQNQIQVLWIIWVAMIVTLGIYVLVCHLVIDGIRQSVDSDFTFSMLRNILYGVAIFTLFVAHFVRKFILTPRSGVAESMSEQTPPLKDPSQLIGKYTIAMLLSLAFSEMIGIFGLVLFFLGDSFQTLYIFIGISALGMFHYRPRRAEINKMLTAVQPSGAIVPER